MGSGSNGSYGGYLFTSEGQDPRSEFLKALDHLEEEQSVKNLLARSQDWVSITADTPLTINLDEIYRFFQYGWHFRGPIRNVTRNLKYLTGVPRIQLPSKADENEWKKTTQVHGNHWDKRVAQIIQNVLLQSDYFTLVYPPDIMARGARIRNLEPYKIHKVEKDQDDPAIVTGYRMHGRSDKIDPDLVVHHVMDTVGNEDRGMPLLCGALRPLMYIYKWEQDLYYLGHIRARFPIVRKVRGTSTDVTNEANRYQYLPGPGRMLIENEGMDTQYPPAFSGTGDASEGWEVFARSISMTAGLPFFLVTMDFRENSLASSLSADSPLAKYIMDVRNTVGADIKTIIRKSLRDESAEVNLDWPPVIERDKQKMATAYEIGIRNGAISSQDMCEDVFDKDWDETLKRIKDEIRRSKENWDDPKPQGAAVP